MSNLIVRLRRFFTSKFEQTINVFKRTSFPGFEKIPIYDVMTFFLKEIKRDRITMRASAISFSFLLAIFPSVIFLFTLIAYIPIENLNDYILATFRDIMPQSGYIFLSSTIDDIVSIQRSGLLSLGFILTFYFSTNGVRGIMLAFNKDHPLYKRRGFWRGRMAAFRLTIYLFLLFIISMILIIAGDYIVSIAGKKLGWQNSTGYFFLSLTQWAMIVFLIFSGITLIYYYGPSKHSRRFRFFSPGATFATFLSMLASIGFAFFVNNFGRYNEVYGSIGTLIVLMVWININSLVLLVGFELNNSIDVNSVLRKTPPEN